MKILPLLYWLGVGLTTIASILATIYIAIKMFTKENFRSFLRYLVFPRPVLTYGILSIFSFFINDKILSSIILLRNTIEKRFGSYNNVPLIINLGQVNAISGNNVVFNASGVRWYVSNKVACVNIPLENLEEILCLLVDILPGRSFDVINIVLPINSIKENTPSNLNDYLEVIKKISNIKCDIFVTVHIPNFHLPVPETSVGFNLTGVTKGYIMKDFDNFLSLFMNKIMLNSNNITKCVSEVLLLYDNKVTLIEFLSTLSALNEQVKGVYFLGNKYLEPEQIYWNNLAEILFFNHSNDAVLLADNSYARRNSVINKMFIIGSVLSVFFMIWYVPYKTRFFTNFNKTINKVATTRVTDNIANTNLINDLQVEKLGLINKLLHNKYYDYLGNMRDRLSTRTKNIHSDLSKLNVKSANENITDPMNSQVFTQLSNHVERTHEIVDKLHNFQINTYGKTSESLKENLNKVKNDLVKHYVVFFDCLKNNQFSQIVKEIISALNTLVKDPNVTKDNIYYLRNLFNKLEILLEQQKQYQWWLKKRNLGYKYNRLIDTLERIPVIGKEMSEDVASKEEQAITNIKYSNVQAKHSLIGLFFDLQNNEIKLSRETTKFINLLDWCLMQPIVQLNTQNVEVPQFSKEYYYMWDCEKLENVIYYINTREKFMEDIKQYGNLIGNVLQKVSDNTLKSFVNSQLILAAFPEGTDIGTEIKVNNLQNAYKLIKKIQGLCKLHLRYKVKNVLFIIQDNVHQLVHTINHELNNTIYTAYSNLDQWDGQEDIIKYLFSVNKSEFGVVLNNGLNDFKNIYTNYIEPILELLNEYSNQDYKKFKYIGEQIKMYENNKKNDISIFEDFLNELTDWKIMWHPLKQPGFVKDFFFKKHLEQFKKNVYGATNRICLLKSIGYYNELADFFNRKIKGKFPFGNGYELDSKILADFLVMYGKYRKHLLQDQGFLDIISESVQMRNVMETLEKINAFFIVNYPNVQYNVKLHFDTEDGEKKHTNLLYKIVSQFSIKSLYKSEMVEHKSNVDDFMGITVAIAKSSSMIFSTEIPEINYYPTMLKVYYATPYGYIRFINRFIYNSKEKYKVLRFKFPLIKKDDTKKQIIAALDFWGRAYDVPDFIFDMPKITSF